VAHKSRQSSGRRSIRTTNRAVVIQRSDGASHSNGRRGGHTRARVTRSAPATSPRHHLSQRDRTLHTRQIVESPRGDARCGATLGLHRPANTRIGKMVWRTVETRAALEPTVLKSNARQCFEVLPVAIPSDVREWAIGGESREGADKKAGTRVVVDSADTAASANDGRARLPSPRVTTDANASQILAAQGKPRTTAGLTNWSSCRPRESRQQGSFTDSMCAVRSFRSINRCTNVQCPDRPDHGSFGKLAKLAVSRSELCASKRGIGDGPPADSHRARSLSVITADSSSLRLEGVLVIRQHIQPACGDDKRRNWGGGGGSAIVLADVSCEKKHF